ncbi:RNA-directed DNA polymerase, eukaryota, Reverse transcriptase zinc-binding domain protein [Thalictrum thalictroides]|uniref:RNA-directed DNA polymerase, eukaryota, Reverse transcriptase zinc-binding domain protein n=1 Tax=Thalictrum thalictroides TaxID=46969 RepID=A0A7J6XD13_THATH|nr:RNA-directed DNA polymerase, eukaryota, Reverse transcriptase zinc-binding domain protein [Thalictrum thalictroides]
MSEQDGQAMGAILGITLVKLLVNYLGVPPVSSRMGINECLPLMEKITTKIFNWKNIILSHAGRLELMKSILHSFHVYWSRTFVLPSTFLDQVQKKCIKLLGSGPAMAKILHQARAETVCLPAKEGGLSRTDLARWNKAASMGLVFKIDANDDFLWVKCSRDRLPRGKFFGLIIFLLRIATGCGKMC